MACRNCGSDNIPEATVCSECGAELGTPPQAPGGTPPVAPAISAPRDPEAPTRPRSASRGLATVLAVVAAIVILAACSIFGVANVVALRQLHERSLRRNAITQQVAVPAPNTVGQTDNESGPSEPDTDQTSGTAGGSAARTYAAGTPEATVADWYKELDARDAVDLRALALPGLASAIARTLASSTPVTAYRITSVKTVGSVSAVTVEQTAGTRSAVRFGLVRTSSGHWLVASFR